MARHLTAFVLALSLAGPAWGQAFENGLDAAERGDHPAALELFTEAIASGSLSGQELAYAYSNRGFVQSSLGNDEEAVADYTEALRLAPEEADIYSNRANAYRRLGDHERALADYQEAIRLRPDDGKLLYNLGNTHLSLGQYDQAIDAFTQSLVNDPVEPHKVHNNRGIAYDRQGERELAIQDYDAAIRLDADYATAYYNRALAHAGLGDVERALADLRQATVLDPDETTFQAKLEELGGVTAEAAEAPPVEPDEAAAAPAAGETAPEEAAAPEPEAAETAEAEAAGTAATESESQAAADETEPAAETAAVEPEAPEAAGSAEGRPYQASEDVNLRAGPGPDNAKLAVIYGGDRVQVVGESGGWFEIVLPDGTRGFASSRYFREAE